MTLSIEIVNAADTERLAERGSLADELYELTTWLETSGANAKVKRVTEIKKALVQIADTEWNDRSEARDMLGTVAIARVGAASCKRQVTDPKAILAHLVGSLGEEAGEEAFWAGITVPLGFVDKYLTEAEQLGIVSSENTGSRTTTVKKRA